MEITYLQASLGFAVALLTGLMAGFGGAWVAIRVLGKEIEWINKTLDKHDKSIDRLHSRLTDHVAHLHANNKGDL